MDRGVFDNDNWYDSIDSSYAHLHLYSKTISLTSLGDINSFFSDCDLPLVIFEYQLPRIASIRDAVLSSTFLTESECADVISELVPNRHDALRILQNANLEPSLPQGGSLCTVNTGNNCSYPRINQSSAMQKEKIVNNLIDFHRNTSADGIACDELIYMLNGSVHFYFFTPRGVVYLDVTSVDGVGWLLVYKGSIPHGGVFSPIAKQLAMLIGPEKWKMTFYSLEKLLAEPSL
jgi:hypothetical protein